MPRRIEPTSFQRHLQLEVPSFLYHYTNHDGLLGIVNSHELWASKVAYLNDATEFQTACDVALNRMEKELPPLGLFTLDPSHTPRQLAAKSLWHFTRNAIEERSNVFVASFCSNGDLLSQWRGYSGGRYAISIGFDAGKLTQVALRNGFYLGKCIYDKTTQDQMMFEAIEKAINGFVSRTGSKDNICREFVAALSRMAVLFKNESFIEEDEWRLSLSINTKTRPDVRFRRGRSTLIPYVTIPFGRSRTSLVDHIYVGPCPNMELAEKSTAWLLAQTTLIDPSKHSKTEDLVRTSQIPFRDW